MTENTGLLAGRPVNRIGFGAMQLPGPGVMGPPKDHQGALAVLRRAVELGANHIDTAQFYGPDVANELIREALHPYPDDLQLVSKVGAVRDDEGNFLPAQRPEDLIADVEANLSSLGVEQLAAVNLRLHDDTGSAAVPLEDQLAAMESLRTDGKIAGIGLSNASPAQVRQAHERVGLVCVQNAYSLVDQSDAETLDYCTEQGIAYVPFFPLGSAFPGLPKVTDQPTVQQVAEQLGVTPAQVGLAWLLGRGDTVLLIPGTSSLEHLEQNMAVRGVELDSATARQLDAAAS